MLLATQSYIQIDLLSKVVQLIRNITCEIRSLLLLFPFRIPPFPFFLFFFFNDPATPEFYPLPLHDALPICSSGGARATMNPNCLRTLATRPSSTGSTSRSMSPAPVAIDLLVDPVDEGRLASVLKQ